MKKYGLLDKYADYIEHPIPLEFYRLTRRLLRSIENDNIEHYNAAIEGLSELLDRIEGDTCANGESASFQYRTEKDLCPFSIINGDPHELHCEYNWNCRLDVRCCGPVAEICG